MKQVFSAYVSSWREGFKYRKPIILLYIINVLLTYIVTSPFTMYFKNKMEQSNALEYYGEGFDISAVMEFMLNYGQALEPLNILLLLFLISTFIYGVYINSCMLYAVLSKNKMIALRPFLNGGLYYFWKILRMSLYYIIAVGISIFLTWKILVAVDIHVLTVKSDSEIIRKMVVAGVILIFILMIFSVIKQYTKILIAIDQKPIITAAILKSSIFSFRHFAKTFVLYILNIGVLVLVIVLYHWIKSMINVNSWILVFFLAQMLLAFKIIVRILHLDNSYKLYCSLKY